MTELDFGGFPPQEGFVVDYEEMTGHSKLGQAPGEPGVSVARPIGTNDLHISYGVGEAGATAPWHTHAPGMYQCILPLEGRVKYWYKDNDGDDHSAVVGPGQMLYLPNGAHNKAEHVDDARVLVVECRETYNARVDHMLAEPTGDGAPGEVYDPSDNRWGVWYDNLRGVVHEMDEDVVRRF